MKGLSSLLVLFVGMVVSTSIDYVIVDDQQDIWLDNADIGDILVDDIQAVRDSLCGTYDLLINDEIIDCNDVEFRLKSRKDPHVIDKRSVDDEPVEGSGEEPATYSETKPDEESAPAEKDSASEPANVEAEVEEPVAADQEPASVPVDEEPAPAPAEDQSAAGEEQPAPAEKESVAAEEQPAPAEEESAPVEEQQAPAEEVSAPVEEQPAPPEEESAPAPVDEQPAQTDEYQAPTKEESDPVEEVQEPASVDEEEEVAAPAVEPPTVDEAPVSEKDSSPVEESPNQEDASAALEPRKEDAAPEVREPAATEPAHIADEVEVNPSLPPLVHAAVSTIATPKESEPLDHAQSNNAELTNSNHSEGPVEGSGTEKKLSAMAPKSSIGNSESSETEKTGASETNVSKSGSKDATILVILFAVVIVIGAAAFAHHLVLKKKEKKRQNREAENGKSVDVEQGTEMKPLIKNNNPVITKEYSDSNNKEVPA